MWQRRARKQWNETNVAYVIANEKLTLPHVPLATASHLFCKTNMPLSYFRSWQMKPKQNYSGFLILREIRDACPFDVRIFSVKSWLHVLAFYNFAKMKILKRVVSRCRYLQLLLNDTSANPDTMKFWLKCMMVTTNARILMLDTIRTKTRLFVSLI